MLAPEDVLLTPHATWYSLEQFGISEWSANEVCRTIEGDQPIHLIEDQVWF